MEALTLTELFRGAICTTDCTGGIQCCTRRTTDAMPFDGAAGPGKSPNTKPRQSHASSPSSLANSTTTSVASTSQPVQRSRYAQLQELVVHPILACADPACGNRFIGLELAAMAKAKAHIKDAHPAVVGEPQRFGYRIKNQQGGSLRILKSHFRKFKPSQRPWTQQEDRFLVSFLCNTKELINWSYVSTHRELATRSEDEVQARFFALWGASQEKSSQARAGLEQPTRSPPVAPLLNAGPSSGIPNDPLPRSSSANTSHRAPYTARLPASDPDPVPSISPNDVPPRPRQRSRPRQPNHHESKTLSPPCEAIARSPDAHLSTSEEPQARPPKKPKLAIPERLSRSNIVASPDFPLHVDEVASGASTPDLSHPPHLESLTSSAVSATVSDSASTSAPKTKRPTPMRWSIKEDIILLRYHQTYASRAHYHAVQNIHLFPGRTAVAIRNRLYGFKSALKVATEDEIARLEDLRRQSIAQGEDNEDLELDRHFPAPSSADGSSLPTPTADPLLFPASTTLTSTTAINGDVGEPKRKRQRRNKNRDSLPGEMGSRFSYKWLETWDREAAFVELESKLGLLVELANGL